MYHHNMPKSLRINTVATHTVLLHPGWKLQALSDVGNVSVGRFNLVPTVPAPFHPLGAAGALGTQHHNTGEGTGSGTETIHIVTHRTKRSK